MPAVNFRELMKLNRTTVERPKSAPACWLIGTVGQMVHETVGQNQTDKLTWSILNLEPHPDTEEGLLDGIDLSKLRSPFSKSKGLEVTYWITPDAVHFLSDMLDRVVGMDERDLEEKLPDMRGQRVMFKISPHIVDNVDSGQNNVDGRTLQAAE